MFTKSQHHTTYEAFHVIHSMSYVYYNVSRFVNKNLLMRRLLHNDAELVLSVLLLKLIRQLTYTLFHAL